MGIDARTGRWSRLVVGAACAAAITVGLPGVALAAPSVPPAVPSAQSTASLRRSPPPGPPQNPPPGPLTPPGAPAPRGRRTAGRRPW
jgi:hypothetical protein